jgi:hypothetical protein
MERYSIVEYADMHFVYGLAEGNARLAERLYTQRFPHRQHPNHKVFIAVHNRIRETGSVVPNKQEVGRPRSVRTADFEEDVLQKIEDNPSTSTRAIASAMHTNKNAVWNVLHEQLFHPFKVQKVQALEPEDHPKRVESARWFLHKELDKPNFLKSVLFTDEASFTREGVVNMKNNHVWAQENPHETMNRNFQVKFSVNVWAGIVNDQLIGPYILPNRLNGQRYLIFLQDVLPELLEDVPMAIRQDMWFQHDGAPPHFAGEVRDHLDEVYDNRWIGRGGPVAWPPRSPDLTPIDFYLWGHMKQLVYSTPVLDAMDLVARIVEASEVIREQNAFEEIRQSAVRRFTLCNRFGGGHVEHMLKNNI